jgi:hypothetical protein
MHDFVCIPEGATVEQDSCKEALIHPQEAVCLKYPYTGVMLHDKALLLV